MVPLHIHIVVKVFWQHDQWESNYIDQYTCILTKNAQNLNTNLTQNESKKYLLSVLIFEPGYLR
jgi:hypothetical protein